MSKTNLLKFLQTQKVLIIASQNKQGELRTANVYYGIDNDFKMYFLSGEDTIHSQNILNDGNVAYSVVWYNSKDHTDRKAIQGKGFCRKTQDENEIIEGIRLHNLNYPEFADRITVDWVKSNDNNADVWVVESSYIKFWNDELYGNNGTEEFIF